MDISTQFLIHAILCFVCSFIASIASYIVYDNIQRRKTVQTSEESVIYSKSYIGPKPVRCITTGVVYRSVSDACKAYGVSRNTMLRRIKDPDCYSKVLGDTKFEFINK